MAWLLPSLGAGDAAVAGLGDVVTIVLLGAFVVSLGVWLWWVIAIPMVHESWLSISLTVGTFGLIFA